MPMTAPVPVQNHDSSFWIGQPAVSSGPGPDELYGQWQQAHVEMQWLRERVAILEKELGLADRAIRAAIRSADVRCHNARQETRDWQRRFNEMQAANYQLRQELQEVHQGSAGGLWIAQA